MFSSLQPQSWIKDKAAADVVFECLQWCEDPAAACQALDSICSALFKPSKGFPFPPPPLSSSDSLTENNPYGDGDGDADPESSGDDETSLSSPPPARRMSSTGLYSLLFSLLDSLKCWKLASPQLKRLVSLDPGEFAGTVIARAAASAEGGGAAGKAPQGEGSLMPISGSPGCAAAAPADGDAALERAEAIVGVGPRTGKKERGGDSTSTSGSRQSSSESSAADSVFAAGVELAPSSVSAPDGGGGVGGMSCGEAGDAPEAWREIVGEVIASAMPEIARGKMRGEQGWCGATDINSDPCVSATDCANSSSLPLLTFALQDAVGALNGARLVRENFHWIVNGVGDSEDPSTAAREAIAPTLEYQNKRMDQLSGLLWSLGDLRRSLPLQSKAAQPNAIADQVAATATAAAVAAGGDSAATMEAVAGAAELGAELSDDAFMRMVVGELQVHLVRILDAGASAALPECAYPSFQMDAGYACEHAGNRVEEGGCVTCVHVIKPFLENPFECQTSWEPWAGAAGDEFSPEFYQRLGLRCSVEGDARKVGRRCMRSRATR